VAESLTLEDLARDARRSYQTLEDLVHHVVREAIVRGIYPPGERLQQDRIAEVMGVSRIPVRAALRRLEAERFVEFVPHRGATVKELSPKEIAEIYDLRVLLETYALRAAAEHITASELDELEELADRMDATGDPEEWVVARQRFYEHLYEIADRPRSAELIKQLRADVGRYWLVERVAHDHEGAGHAVIVAALRKGKPTEAESWLQDHLSDVSKQLQLRVARATADG
jgi:DNA-binding GntR family transcriptional regulator